MILGENDWIVNAEDQKEKFAPYLEYFSIIKGGHMSHISNCRILIQEVMNFLG